MRNTKATNAFATSISIGDTTTTGVNGMITSETSPAIITQITPYAVKDIFSLTAANRNIAISTMMTETSTPTRAGIKQVTNIDLICNF